MIVIDRAGRLQSTARSDDHRQRRQAGDSADDLRDDNVVEQLEADRRPRLITRSQRHRGRESPAGTVTCHRDPPRVQATR